MIDKTVVKQLQDEIKGYIENGRYDSAQKLDQKQLKEMSDKITSYNPKLDEYIDFLKKYISDNSICKIVEEEIDRIINNYPVSMEERYLLFMLVGNKFSEWKEVELAKDWYLKAEEIHKAGFVKSDKASKMLSKIIDGE